MNQQKLAVNMNIILRSDIEFLIVEDERAHFVLARICLERAGIENKINWFENGQEVLDFLRGSGHPSINNKKYIMLLDVRMPSMDGIEVLRRIKSDDMLKSIQVIMLTTSDDQQQAKVCYELGCIAHVTKPPNEALLSAIKRASHRPQIA
ncbi:MAG: response regulator [Phycisphaerae bacterium]|nr:response regulator [Phycisphaerae bacterium]